MERQVYVAGNQRRCVSRPARTARIGCVPDAGRARDPHPAVDDRGVAARVDLEVVRRCVQVADQAGRVLAEPSGQREVGGACQSRLEEAPDEGRDAGRRTGGMGRPRGPHATQPRRLQAGHRARPVAERVADAPRRGERLVETDRQRQRHGRAGRVPPGPPAAAAARRRARRSPPGELSAATWSSVARKEPLASTWSVRSGCAALRARTGSTSHPGSIFTRSRAAPPRTAVAACAAQCVQVASGRDPDDGPDGHRLEAPAVPSAAAIDWPAIRSSASDTAISKAAATMRSTAEPPKSCGTSAPVGSSPPLAALARTRRGHPALGGGGLDLVQRRVDRGALRQRTAFAPALALGGRRHGRRGAAAVGAPRPRCRCPRGRAHRRGPVRPLRASRRGHSHRGNRRGSLYALAFLPGWRNGRRGGLKSRCPKGRAGSSPAPGTAFSL